MPSFFAFQQGSESRARLSASEDASPLLGRFRAVPGAARRPSLLGSTRENIFRSIGYGTLFGNRSEESLVDEVGGFTAGQGIGPGGSAGSVGDGGFWEVGGWAGGLRDVWIRPRQGAVRRVVERWWRRWVVLMGLPAGIVSFVFFCILYLVFDGGPGEERRGEEREGRGYG
jgi:hypothetical protein